jgi:uncharacterized protein
MRIEITSTTDRFNLAPATVIEEVIQNVRMILTTRRGTVPLDRNFGLDWAFVDQPPDVSRARMTADIISQVRRYEPRAKVVQVLIDPSTDPAQGIFKPRVIIEVNA